MQQKDMTEQLQENVQNVVEGAKQEVVTARRSWYYTIRWGGILLGVYAIVLILFGLLAVWVHFHSVLPVDIAITQEFQENPSPWLRYSMLAVSYFGSTILVIVLVIALTAAIFWAVGLRLEAITVISLSAASTILNGLIKLIVARPRPMAPLVEVIQVVGGQSFPSGHVMLYIAFWGLLFSLVIILFQGKRWWRIALLIIPALFVILVGPSRIYLGAHWASDVLGAYLIGGVLLGVALSIYLRLKRKGVLSVKGPGEMP